MTASEGNMGNCHPSKTNVNLASPLSTLVFSGRQFPMLSSCVVNIYIIPCYIIYMFVGNLTTSTCAVQTHMYSRMSIFSIPFQNISIFKMYLQMQVQENDLYCKTDLILFVFSLFDIFMYMIAVKYFPLFWYWLKVYD